MVARLPAYALLAGLAIALLAAAFTDIRRRRIDNRLTAAVAVAAPLFWWATGVALWPGAAFRFGFALTMLMLLAALFAIRAMGGGDVKLLTGLALWLPWQPFLQLVVLMSLFGGVLTLVFAAAWRLRGRPGALEIPYGVAIAAAGLWVVGTGVRSPHGLLG